MADEQTTPTENESRSRNISAFSIKEITTSGVLIATALGLIVIAILLAFYIFRGPIVAAATPNPDKYQAVFLNNGQVYFGKLKDTNGRYLTLEDVYYVQSQSPANGAQAAGNPNSQNSLSLIKLGEEIHGPERSMYIAREQVVSYEDLKDDGKVVSAIKKGADQPAPAASDAPIK